MSIISEDDKKAFIAFVQNSRNWFQADEKTPDEKRANISVMGDKIQELYSYEIELKKKEFDKAKTSLSTFKNINDEFKIFTQDEDYKN